MIDNALAATLCGSWLLSSWAVTEEPPSGSAKGDTRYPFGRQPTGLLLYAPDGYMSATVSAGGRRPLAQDLSPRQAPATDLAAAFTSYFHYAGRWRVDGQYVVHEIMSSLNPNMVGSSQTRQVSLLGTELVLAGVEQLPNCRRRHVLQWRRASNPQEPE